MFFDIVDMQPTTFETKKAETSTAATTQDAIGDIQEVSADGIIAPINTDVNTKYSLTAEQQEYFKDSKVRDKNGNLQVVYRKHNLHFVLCI